MRTSLLVLVGLVALSSLASAGPPDIVNAEIVIEPAGASLGSSVGDLLNQATEPAGSPGAYRPSKDIDISAAGAGATSCRAGGPALWKVAIVISSCRTVTISIARRKFGRSSVLVRAEGNGVEEVRVYSETCQLDAGGRTVIWLESADADQSVAWLASLIDEVVDRGDPEDLADEALLALALHEGAAADRELAAIASSGPSGLSARGGHLLARGGQGTGRSGSPGSSARRREGCGHQDPHRLRSHPELGAGCHRSIDDSGTSGPGPRGARRCALLVGPGRRCGGRRGIQSAVESDASRDVREQAIFALSQLPNGQGTDLLLEIVRDKSQEASVRQHALFWLAQSEDDRALDLISDLLQ